MTKASLFLVVLGLVGSVAAEDVLIRKIQLEARKNAYTWSIPEIKSNNRVANNAFELTIVRNDNNSQASNGQLIVVQNPAIQPGKKYRLDFTLKSSADVVVGAKVIRNQSPYINLGAKNVPLTKDVPQNISLDISSANAINDAYRMPCISYGKLPVGTKLELSNIKFFEIK